MSPQDKLIDKLQKLYAKAESSKELGNEAEAMAFMAKVQELLKKHKLDASILTLAQRDEAEPMGETRVSPWGKMQRIAWAEQLASRLARAFHCKLLVIPGSDKIVLVGRKTDRDVAEYVFIKLINFLEADCKKQHGALRYRLWKEKGDMSEAHGFKASYFNAAVNRIGQRLREQEVQDTSDKKYALVVTRSKEEVDNWMADQGYGTRPASRVKGQRGYNPAGHEAGRAAGSRADLSGRGLDGGSKGGRIGRGS